MAVNMKMITHETLGRFGTLLDSYWDDEIDEILIPDDFPNEESIQYVLDRCTHEAWDHVYANRKKYSNRIRYMIEPRDFWAASGLMKMKVRELTETEIERRDAEERALKIKEFEEKVWNTMKSHIPDRPVDDLDDEIDEAWEKLSAAKDRMTKFLSKKKTGSYVPPSARTIDPERKKIEDAIADCQSTFNDITKRIAEADARYMEQQKTEEFNRWMNQQ